MPLNYDPQDAVTCWQEGEYEAVLERVQDTHSKTTGNPMQAWTIKVYNTRGESQTVDDYVVVPAATWKIKQLAGALGKRREFDAGQFQADNEIGANLLVDLVIEEQEGYDDRNKIGRYRPLPQQGPVNEPSQQAQPREYKEPADAGGPHTPVDDDSIPF